MIVAIIGEFIIISQSKQVVNYEFPKSLPLSLSFSSTSLVHLFSIIKLMRDHRLICMISIVQSTSMQPK